MINDDCGISCLYSMERFMFKKYKLRSYNFRLAILAITASIYGIVMINSADSSFTLKQCFGLALSVMIMLVLSFIDYKWILKYYWIIYIIDVMLLLGVKLFGKGSHGAKRWLDLKAFQLQPSELSKIFLILVTVKILSMYKDKINDWKFLVILAVVLGIPLILVAIQPDLSTTIITFIILFTIVFCAGLSYKIIGLVLVIVVPILVGGFIYISNPDNEVFFLRDYQRERIMDFIHGDENDDGVYQQKMSETAIGSGRLKGKGLDNDDPSSLKNAHYIPEAQTDFIFTIIGEELGFIGCVSVILLLFWIIIECIISAVRIKDFAGRLICCGVAAYIGFQSFINIGVVTRILPNTGLPLPFFSYGLTSLVTLFISLGVVLNINLQIKSEKDDDIFAKDFRG